MDTATEHAWKLVGLLERAGLILDHRHAAILRDATVCRDAQHWGPRTVSPDVLKQFPARDPHYWPGTYGKFTSPPWDESAKAYADRVTRTSRDAISICQERARQRERERSPDYTCPVCDGGPGNNCACSCPKG